MFNKRGLQTIYLILFILVAAFLYSLVLESLEKEVSYSPVIRIVDRDIGQDLSYSEIKPFDYKGKQERINEILVRGKILTKQGKLEVMAIDDFENRRSDTLYYLKDNNGKKSRIYFNSQPPFISGTELIVGGNVLSFGNNEEIFVERRTNCAGGRHSVGGMC